MRFAKRYLQDIKIDKYYVALLAFEEGYKNVVAEQCFKQVIVHEILSDTWRAFSPNSQVFKDAHLRERIEKLCNKYGEELYEHPLGYDDSQALIVFPHNTPNNTLPIIWASENNEKKPGRVWYPVWERKKASKQELQITAGKVASPAGARALMVQHLARQRPGLLAGNLAGEVPADQWLLVPLPWRRLGDASPGTGEVGARLREGLTNRESLLLLGDSGQGKTTVLKRLALDLVDECLAGRKAPLPVFVGLRDLDDFTLRSDDDPSHWVWQYMELSGVRPPIQEAEFRNLVSDGHIVLILDGVDEVTSDVGQQALNDRVRAFSPICPTVLSCRKTFYDFFLSYSSLASKYSEKIELLPLRPGEEMRAYVSKRSASGEEADRLIRLVEEIPQMADLARRPLLLSMMVTLGGPSRELAAKDPNISNLYELYIAEWLKKESGRAGAILSWEQRFQVMQTLAWRTFRASDAFRSRDVPVYGQARPFRRDDVRASVMASGYGLDHPTDRLVDDICFQSLLVGGAGGAWHFTHKSFHEFLVAWHIFEEMKAGAMNAGAVLGEFIPVEVDTFLRGLATQRVVSAHERKILGVNLCEAYRSHSGDDATSITVRDHAGFYLARLILPEADRFLAAAVENETDPVVRRSIVVALGVYCGRPDVVAGYICEMQSARALADINLGYHLVYYGDRSVEAGYGVKTVERFDATKQAILRHLRNEDYAPHWPLDLFTLKDLGRKIGWDRMGLEPTDLHFLRSFLRSTLDGQGYLASEARELLQEIDASQPG